MIRAFFLSVGQLGDPRILGVLLRSLLITLALFVALGLAAYAGLIRVVSAAGDGWAAAGAVVVAMLAAWLLFRSVAVAVVGLFADGVVDAVEARHYPAAAATRRPVPLGQSLRMGGTQAALAIAVNIGLLPLYLVALPTGVGTPLLFLIPNGWLLGRELSAMVAIRHVDPHERDRWRASTRQGRFALGLVAAALFLIPGVNLLAPVLGAAMATHRFYRTRA